MYVAQRKIKGKTHYFIRESFRDGGCLRSHDLFDLGTNPATHIVYPGGNAYYVDDVVEERLCSLGVTYSTHDLDDLFWPFVKPEIRRALEWFRQRPKTRAPREAINAEEQEKVRMQVSAFDKRRVHYLRCGRIDQGGIGRMPVNLFKWAVGKSRDEIEQHFMEMERSLDPSELKTYAYVIFDLQKFFSETIAKKMPQGLDQNKVDNYFLDEICRLNSDCSFWTGEACGNFLHEYLVRYVVMFFDNDYDAHTPLHDYMEYFANAKWFYKDPAKKRSVSFEEASTLFGVPEKALRTMTKRGLTRLYRRKAQKLHPDKGGTHEKFIKLTEAYKDLLKR